MKIKYKKLKIFSGLGIFLLTTILFFYFSVKTTPPTISDLSIINEKRTEINDSTFQIKNAFLKKNKYGLWELFVQGKPFDRGVKMSILSKELLIHQERAFVNGMKEIVPSETWLNVLKYFVAWQNRELEDYIPEEYRKEIYGISRFAADEYDFIGPKYHRKLAYHAAHDIGHTLQNLGLVGGGCTTFSTWGEQSADSSLILGRNFDFYVGDDFAKNKVVYFVKPSSGIDYVSVSWPGMIGVVSGMNMSGLAVVLNAGPPAIPGTSKTPVSILAREILQYANNIEEAFDIAKKRETFVSENIILSSAEDGKTVVIEKTPEQTILNDKNNLVNGNFVCSNHFQTAEFEQSEQNLTAKNETSTIDRYARMSELLNENEKISVQKAAEILRDQKGLNDKNIGFGNEMALNQLLAHHSVIFKPQKRQIWVSTSPWQLGEFVGYDLNSIFKNDSLTNSIEVSDKLFEPNLLITKDSVIYSNKFNKFLKFRELQKEIIKATKENFPFNNEKLALFETLNPEHYQTWGTLGKYFQSQNDYQKATSFFERALTKSIPWRKDKEEILELIRECED